PGSHLARTFDECASSLFCESSLTGSAFSFAPLILRLRHSSESRARKSCWELDTQSGRWTMSGRSRTSVEVPMSDRDQLYPLDQRAWLLAIGRRLRVEYDTIAEPVPPRLAALVKQLE